MRKYVVPSMLLAGIALLSLRADAASMVAKSRAIDPGKSGSIPISLIDVANYNATTKTGIWGVDAGLFFSNAALTAPTDPSNAFVARTGVLNSATDVVVSGSTFVGTGTNPNLYFGILKGTDPLVSTAAIGAGATSTIQSLGLLKVKVTAGTPLKTVITITTNTYNVQNSVDGSGNPVNNPRPGATGVNTTGTAGATLTAENPTILSGPMPGYAAPAAGEADLRVPLGKVAVVAPGDANGDGAVDLTDVAFVARATANVSTTVPLVDDTARIAGDVAPNNGAVAGSPQGDGTYGGGYGDGVVDITDLALLARNIAGITTAVLPVAE